MFVEGNNISKGDPSATAGDITNEILGLYEPGSADSGNEGFRVVVYQPFTWRFLSIEGFDVPP